jgi:hypothetical protein
MNIQDRIRQLQSNVVRPGVNSAGVRPPAQQAAPETPEQRSDRLSGEASAMSEDQFTEAFKRQVQARDAKLVEQANAQAQPSFEDRMKANWEAMNRDGAVSPRHHMPAVSQARRYDSSGNRMEPTFDQLRDWNQSDVTAGRVPAGRNTPGTLESITNQVNRRHFPDGLPSDDAPNSIADRIRAARKTGIGDAPQVSALAQQMMYNPDGSKRRLPSREMLDKWSDIDAQAGRKRQDGGHIAVPPVRPYTDADAMDARREMLQEHNQENRRRNASYGSVGPRALPGILPPDQAAAQQSRDTHAERIGQLTESGLTPDEAGRVAGFERSVHGDASAQLSTANDTPEAKAERARRVEGLRRTEARQDNYARSQLDGHLTGREAFEARAQQEGLRGAPAAKPQGWQPISQQDFTDRAAGYGLSPEEAARAYGERPGVMRDTGNNRVLQAQASRAQEEWLKTMPGVHRKHATNDQAQYGDGKPADQITPEQYNARIERRNQERAALDPGYAADRQVAKLAKASGKTPEEVEAEMFPKGRPQPSEEFKERQAARKAQHARANEAIWERNGYRGHLDAKTSSGDPATVREGLSRLAEITGNPMYLERMKAMDAEDAAKGEHTRGMEKLTAEQKHALGMQDDLQAGDIEMEGVRQKGAKDARDDQAAENEKDRTWKSGEAAAEGGRALSVIELNQKNELERMEKAGTISNESAEKLADLRQKEATHAAGLAEAKAAKDAERQLAQTGAEGDAAVRVKQAEKAAAGTPQSTANGYADEAFANPALSMGNAQNELESRLRNDHPHLTETQARDLAASTMRRRALMHGAGNSGAGMHIGIRGHLRQEMERTGPDGKPIVDAVTGKPSKPMTVEEFRAYAMEHAGLDAARADGLYNDLSGTTPTTSPLPPPPPTRGGFDPRTGRPLPGPGSSRVRPGAPPSPRSR